MISSIKKISVIVPCFNQARFLHESLLSVLYQTHQNWECVIVDDESTDDTPEIALEWTKKDNRFSYVKKKNGGPASARNAGINKTNGDYILPLDADNRLDSEYIKKTVSILDSNPHISIVYSDVRFFGLRSGERRVGSFNIEKVLIENYIDTCAIYRREVWITNNGYDEAGEVRGLEDWDFWINAYKNGCKFKYLPEILFDYRTSTDSMTCRSNYQSAINYISKKHALEYRKTLQKKINEYNLEHESVKACFKNLLRLLRRRLIV
jgi:glycosyltransferase involved in cell wall biosynthesis